MAVKDLDQMLSLMRPQLQPGRYVFTTHTAPLPATAHPVMTFTAAFHDHLFVPADSGDRALQLLEGLSGPGSRQA